MRVADRRVCKIPGCGDRLPAWTRWRLCPSCRLAYGRGALLAAGVALVVQLLEKLLW